MDPSLSVNHIDIHTFNTASADPISSIIVVDTINSSVPDTLRTRIKADYFVRTLLLSIIREQREKKYFINASVI